MDQPSRQRLHQAAEHWRDLAEGLRRAAGQAKDHLERLADYNASESDATSLRQRFEQYSENAEDAERQLKLLQRALDGEDVDVTELLKETEC